MGLRMMTDRAAELAKMWPIFPIGPDNPITLRAISPKGAEFEFPARNITFTAMDFPEVEKRKEAFAKQVLALNREGYNVYTCLNPIKPDFAGDLKNGLAVRDEHIACRQRLLIDLDRANTSNAPATDSEILEANALADRIFDRLQSRFDVEPFRVMSGNGIHLYLPLKNLPNDPDHKELCRQVLINLASEFDTDTMRVDTSVYNAARITKVPGTIARKGIKSPGRPYRMAGLP